MGSTIDTAPVARPLSNAIWLGSAPVEPIPRTVMLLVSPCAQAGFPSPAADYVEDVLDLNALLVTNPPATFYVRCRGRSLIDLGVLDGDILVVDRSLSPARGHVIVAVIDGSLYAKVLERIDGRLALVSRNQTERDGYAPVYFDECQEHVVWGVVTGVARKL